MDNSGKRSPGILHEFMRVDRLHRSIIEQRVEALGVHRSQHFVLMFLSGCSKSPTQNELAKTFGISPSAIAVTLKKLEGAELIRRLPCEGNCRANQVELSEKGLSVVEKSRLLFDEVDSAAFSGFSTEELNSLGDFLRRIQNNLKSIESDSEGSINRE